MKIITKRTEVLCLSRKAIQCTLQVSGNILQKVEKFKYLGLGRYSRVIEGGTGDWYTDWQTQICMSLIVLCLQNGNLTLPIKRR